MHRRKSSSPYTAIYLELNQKVTPKNEESFTEGKILTFRKVPKVFKVPRVPKVVDSE